MRTMAVLEVALLAGDGWDSSRSPVHVERSTSPGIGEVLLGSMGQRFRLSERPRTDDRRQYPMTAFVTMVTATTIATATATHTRSATISSPLPNMCFPFAGPTIVNQ
jgi:hypothetical protein